ncbi:YchJ family metal-binding protein [Microbacterium sp. C7(2022)]|uniref:YchJ family protein n=1 Tax=Microbacterium sp. C7(2022) TaxID=2992759 RepID=UPI00237A8F45|nr:YchJ family metal-binding protein [Microbacterium sp. C7(2022)]MDE0546787.1 YchJ family metal-binding protein [Microbacterium sp. C7(2022)]
MSFGPAAASIDPRFPRITDSQPCPCGTQATFGECCAPLHRGAVAPSPERLMRSRYSAFVVGNARYLADTWHPRTLPDDLVLDPDQRWEGLEVSEASEDGAQGIVRFRAFWRYSSERGILAETSRFRRVGSRWYYLDGDVGDQGAHAD